MLHSANIITHITTGIFALIIGFVILVKKKGTVVHQKLGRWFVYAVVLVISSGTTGVLIFKRNLFLLVITILVGYNTYSGIRNIKTKTNEFSAIDLLIMIIAIFITFYFIYHLNVIGFYWNPIIIYATVGYLFSVIAYDLFRYCIPKSKYGNLWLYEHSCKMISALGGLLSAFVGTVLPDYKPYSQFLPSILMTVVMIGFLINIKQKLKNKQK